jgi:HEAT repeat protein
LATPRSREPRVRQRQKTVGVFTVDRELVVQSWDAWMAEATGIPESAATGEPLGHLYPELAERGLLARLRTVVEGAGVDVLAPAFHKYLLPCAPRDRHSRFERMRQHVTIAPIRNSTGVAGVTVTIKDVTARFDRERRLVADLDNENESVRLAAAQSVVSGGEAPTLLTNALSDASWRVRRVAVEGMGADGGREVVQMLLDIIRDHHRDPALLNSALSALARTRGDAALHIATLLTHAETDVRTYAALALGFSEDPRVVPALIERLGDDDVNVRFHSIEALGRIGDSEAAEPLAAVAESRDFFLAFAALDALALIGEPSVSTRLVVLLDDEMLLPATVVCLGAIGAEDVAAPLAAKIAQQGAPVAAVALALADVYERVEQEHGEGELIADAARSSMSAASATAITDALVTANEDELRGLVTVLSWLPFDGIDRTLAGLFLRAGLQSVVADRMATRGAVAAPFIAEVARGASDEVRSAAAFAFGRIGSAVSVPTLLSWLDGDSSPDVVVAAAGALGAIGDRQAFAPLIALLSHEYAPVRQAAVAALSSVGHPDMEAAVANGLSDGSAAVRESSARIAGYFSYESCLGKMVEACDDAEPSVRRAVIEALANYDDRRAWSRIQQTLAGDGDTAVRAAAARALGHWNADEATDALVAAAGDANLWVRYFGTRSMARRGLGHADVLATLAEQATRDPATPVRIAAIEALGALRADTMLSVLLPLTRDREDDVASAAIATLANFDAAQSAEAITYALHEDNVSRQRAALDAVSAQRADHAVDAVASIARSGTDEDLRRHALETLGAIASGESIHALVDLGGDRRRREAVIVSLAAAATRDIAALEGALGSLSIHGREFAAHALGRLQSSVASRVLSSLLKDDAPAVRTAAARALTRMDLRHARALKPRPTSS